MTVGLDLSPWDPRHHCGYDIIDTLENDIFIFVVIIVLFLIFLS